MTRRTRIIAGLIIALLTATLAGAGWLVFTQSGLDTAVAALGRLSAMSIRVARAEGRLAGPLHLSGVEIDHERVHVSVRDLRADPGLAGLLFARIRLDAVVIDTVRVRVKPRTKPPEPGAPRFMPGLLRLAIGDLRVRNLTVVASSGAELAIRDLTAAAIVSARRIQLERASVDAGAWAVSGSAALLSQEPLGLSVDADFRVPAAHDLAGHVQAQGDLALLTLRGRLAHPTGVTLERATLLLEPTLRWEIRARLADADLSRLTRTELFDRVSGTIAASGDTSHVRASGELDVPRLALGPAQVAVELSHSAAEVSLTKGEIELTKTGSRAEVTGRIRLGGKPELDLAGSWTGLRWPMAGTPDVTSEAGRFTFAGTGPWQFSAAGTVSAGPLREAPVEVEGTLEATRVTIERAAAQVLAGRVTGSGELGFAPEQPWRIALDGSNLDPSRVRDDLPGRLDVRLDAAGEGFDPLRRWDVNIQSLNGVFRHQPVEAHGAASMRDGALSFDNLHASVGNATLTADGSVRGPGGLVAEIQSANLSAFLPELAGSVRGRVRASERGSERGSPGGKPHLGVDLTLSARDLRFGSLSAAAIGADADLDLSDREPSWARVRAVGLSLGERELSDLRLSLDGRASSHAVALRVGLGKDAVELVGRGGFKPDSSYVLDIKGIESRGPRLPTYVLERASVLTATKTSIQLTATCLVAAPRRICLQGDFALTRPWQFTADAAGLSIETLFSKEMDEVRYRGTVGAHASIVGGPDQPWTGSASAVIDDATFSYRRPGGELTSVALGDVRLRADATATQLSASLDAQLTQRSSVTASAIAERTPGLELPALPLAGRIRVDTHELGILPLFVPDIDRARGQVTADIAIGGTIAAPTLEGRLDLVDGELDFYRSNLLLRQMQAGIVFRDNGLTLTATGRAGEGQMTLGGELTWRERQLEGRLTFKGENLVAADLPELHVVASPDLVFRLDGTHVTVTGEVKIPSARVEPADVANVTLASADERIIGEEEPGAAGAFTVSADVRTTLGRDVHVNAFGLKSRLEGSIVARLRPGQAATGSGELEIEDGKFKIYSRELDIERGRLLFGGGPLAEPGVDLKAEREVPGYTVGINARGQLRRPEITFYSSPSLPQTQIASLLVASRTLDSLQASDRSSLGMSTTQMAAQGGALLGGQVKRYIGLDEVSVETGFNDDAALVLGKFLSPRLFVSYGISLSQRLNTLKMKYTVGDRWTVKTESGEEQSLDIEYKIER